MTPQLKRAYNLGRAYAVKSAQILDMMPSTGQLTAVGGLQGLAGGGILGGIAGGAVGGIRGAANHKKDSENSMIQDILKGMLHDGAWGAGIGGAVGGVGGAASAAIVGSKIKAVSDAIRAQELGDLALKPGFKLL